MSSPYRPGAALQSWAKTMPINVEAGPAISGYGSPESVVPAVVGTIYIDLSNSDLYQKERSGGLAVGWVLRGTAWYPWSGTGGGGTTGTGIQFLTTAERDALVPTTEYAVCILTDSVPPFQVSIWSNGAWN